MQNLWYRKMKIFEIYLLAFTFTWVFSLFFKSLFSKRNIFKQLFPNQIQPYGPTCRCCLSLFHFNIYSLWSTPLPLGGIWLDIDINQKLVTINAKSMGMILNLLGVISLAININRKLVTINAKLMGTILNLFIKTGNHTTTILWSINATTGPILLAININWKIVTINVKSMGTILNLFHQNREPHSHNPEIYQSHYHWARSL